MTFNKLVTSCSESEGRKFHSLPSRIMLKFVENCLQPS